MSTEETTALEVPESFDYNETDLRKPLDRYRATDKDECFRGAITVAKRAVSFNKKNPEKSSKNLQLQITIRAVNGSDDLVGPPIVDRLDIPVPNPTVPGHKAFTDADQRDVMFQKARNYIRAVLGDDALPRFAKWDKEAKCSRDPETGEPLSKMEADKMATAVDTATVKQLQAWYKNPDELVGAVLHFGTKISKDGQYTNVSYVTNDPAGKSVATDNFLL